MIALHASFPSDPEKWESGGLHNGPRRTVEQYEVSEATELGL